MENTKVIKLMKTLDQYEIKRFRDFVHSPLFNKKKHVVLLFEELKKHYPAFKENLDEKKIYDNIFPKDKYDYFKMKIALSDLFGLGKEFLSFLKYDKNENAKEKFLLEELRERSLYDFFEQSYKAAEKKIRDLKVKDENYVFHKLDLVYEKISSLSPQKPNKFIHLQQDMLNLFTRYSLIRLLKFYNVMLHEEKQNTYKYDMVMFDEVINYLEKHKIDDNPTLLIYYYIVQLEKNRQDKYFYELKRLGTKYKNELSPYDSYMVFLHLNGYCTNEFNTNSRTDLIKQQFEIVKEKNQNSALDFPKILYPDFLNEVKIAVRADELEWAENYINKFKPKLVEQKDSTMNFCIALINYKKGNLNEALNHFSKTNFPDFIIKLQVKIYELQICFEKEYFDQASLMIDNFRHYVKRENTIKENFKKSFYEFLTLTNNLIKLKTGSYNSEREFIFDKLKQNVRNMKSNQFGIRIWLLSVIQRID